MFGGASQRQLNITQTLDFVQTEIENIQFFPNINKKDRQRELRNFLNILIFFLKRIFIYVKPNSNISIRLNLAYIMFTVKIQNRKKNITRLFYMKIENAEVCDKIK